MSYTFDATSGATRDQLVDLVIANSFSATRYTEFVHGWLNDAVTDVCRKMRLHQGIEILDYDEAGVVEQPTQPFFHVEELWLAYGNATGSGEQAFATYARTRLVPLRGRGTAGMGGTTPTWYTTRREAVTNRYPQLKITVVPATAAGKVAIIGLQRPAIMDSADDVSGLGADVDRALVAYCKARAFEAEDDFEMSQQWEVKYMAAMRDAEWIEGDDDGPHVVEGAWDC